MKLELTVGLRPDAALRLEPCGGASDSLFPEVEALLSSDSDAQEALHFMIGRKDAGRYRSLMDFVFCETFKEHRKPCLAHYAGNGPPLRELVRDPKALAFCDRVLRGAIALAKEAYKRRQRVPWCWFIATAKKAVAAQDP